MSIFFFNFKFKETNRKIDYQKQWKKNAIEGEARIISNLTKEEYHMLPVKKYNIFIFSAIIVRSYHTHVVELDSFALK